MNISSQCARVLSYQLNNQWERECGSFVIFITKMVGVDENHEQRIAKCFFTIHDNMATLKFL